MHLIPERQGECFYLIKVESSRYEDAERILSGKGFDHELLACLEPPLVIESIVHIQHLVQQSHRWSGLPHQDLSLRVRE